MHLLWHLYEKVSHKMQTRRHDIYSDVGSVLYFFFTCIHSPKLKENYFSNPAITSLNQTEVMGAWRAIL